MECLGPNADDLSLSSQDLSMDQSKTLVVATLEPYTDMADSLKLKSDDDLGMIMASVDDRCLETDKGADPHSDRLLVVSSGAENQVCKKQGHQTASASGGNRENLRVLWCTHLYLNTSYETIYNVFCTFGRIERIKLKLGDNDMYFEAFITFMNSDCARSAYEGYDGTAADKNLYKTRLINSRNLVDDEFDFIPSVYMNIGVRQKVDRPKPTPFWHVASYKDGKENMFSGTNCLKRKFGFLPKGNLKKYGRGILIKAENKLQAAMLNNFTPSQDDVISKIVPHHTFNTLKGIIYSRDLFEFSEEEILDMCPGTVYQVKKLNGGNGAILLHFNTRFLSEHIDFEHSRI